jgi:hypothetical protein
MYLMVFRRIQLSAVVMVLFTFLFASGVGQPTDRDAVGPNPAMMKNSSAAPGVNWTFEGCWQPSLGSPCRDIFADQQGNHYICRECGTTGNPTPGKCNPISATTLASGFWCS